MLNVTTNYNGSEAGEIISDIFAAGAMFNPANAKQLWTVSNKMSITMFEDDEFSIGAYSCDFVDGDMALTDKTLNPEKFMVTKSFCKSVLWDTWMAFVRSNNTNPNALRTLEVNNVESFVQYALDYYRRKLAVEVDQIVWASTAGNATPGLAIISGLIEKMEADATVIDVPGAVALTAATVIAAFENVLSAVPSAVLSHPDFKLYVNRRTATLLQIGMTQSGLWGNAANGMVALNYLGYPVVVTEGIADNIIVATYAPNLWMATNIDTFNFNVIDFMTVGQDKLGFRMQFVLDAGFGYGRNIVLYKA